MSRIHWKSSMSSDHPRIEGKRYMPKRPVIWRGNVWIRYKTADEVITDSREWQAPFPIWRKDAQHILSTILAELIEIYGQYDYEVGFELRDTP